MLQVFVCVLIYFQIYTDGTFSGHAPFDYDDFQTQNAPDQTTRQIGFGRKYPDRHQADEYATFAIDDFLIWNGYLLSDAEILQLYNSYQLLIPTIMLRGVISKIRAKWGIVIIVDTADPDKHWQSA